MRPDTTTPQPGEIPEERLPPDMGECECGEPDCGPLRITARSEDSFFDRLSVIAILLILFGLICWGSELPSNERTPTQDIAAGWRRTAKGWERLSHGVPASIVHHQNLHPVLVGLMEILLTVTAMILFTRDNPEKSGSGTARSPC